MTRRTIARLGTLRWRLTLFYCLLLALLLGAFSFFVYSRFQEAQKQNTITRLTDMALVFEPATTANDQLKMELSKGKLAPNDPALAKIAVEEMSQLQQSVQKASSFDGLYIAVLDSRGAVLTSNQPGPDNEKLESINPHLEPVQRTPNPKTGKFAPVTYETQIEQTVAFKSGNGLNRITATVPGMAYVLPFRLYDTAVQKDATPVPPDGYLALVAPIQNDTEALSQLASFLGYGMAGTLLLALLLGLPLARLGLKPLERIAATADRIGSGDLTTRVALPHGAEPEGVRDEVQQLGRAFNEMLDKIEAAFTAQQESEARTRRFAADASHEMRSPLTVLGGYLDVLLMGAKDDPVHEERILHAMKRENNRLSRLVVDLLLLTRIDANSAGILRKEPVRMGALVEQAAENMRVLTGERAFTVSLTEELRAAVVMGDSDHLYRVLANLLDNAIRYTPPGGQISISGGIEAAMLRVDVQDTGCGIEPEQLPRVFDRFYRVDASRTRETGNAGLGLAICKSVVEAHGGQISVQSTPGCGAHFSVQLPLAQITPASSSPQTTAALSKL